MASIRERTNLKGEKNWQVRWVLGGGRPGNGARTASETFYSGRNNAELFARQVEAEGNQWPRGWVKGRGYVDPADLEAKEPESTFEQVADDFFAFQSRRVNLGRLKPYTLHRYRRDYELHLEPSFGPMTFVQISLEDVEDWVDKQLDAGAAPKSVRNRHGLLFMVMAHGVKRMRLRPDNPCELMELPSADSRAVRQVRFFQHGEWALLRSCLNPDVHLLVDVALATGMRWGELSALRVGDVSWRNDAAIIHIVRSWSKRAPNDRAPIDSAEGETLSWILGPPKSKRARHVVVTGELAGRLRAAISDLPTDCYVFRTRYGNPWRPQDFYTDRWKPARDEANKRGLTKHATFHMLRHTAVVWSLAEGVRIEVVSEMLGHASIQITFDVYGGLIDLHDPVMAQAMAKSMAAVSRAIVPAPSLDEVRARKIRPGTRGQSRKRITSNQSELSETRAGTHVDVAPIRLADVDDVACS